MLNYTTYVAELVNLAVETTPPSAPFTAIIPGIIDSAEQKIYRDLDLLSTIIRDSSANVTANSRTFTLPQSIGYFIVTEQLNIVTPSGSTVANGTRNALLPVSKEFIDFTWPSETAPSATTVPQYYAMITDQIVILGPPPGAAFNAEVVGTIRPAPLSAGNPTTFLSLYLPDLLIYASMLFVAAWQKNFGQSSDQPQMAQSWQAQYDIALKSAMNEETRRKYSSASWTSKSISPDAVPQRG